MADVLEKTLSEKSRQRLVTGQLKNIFEKKEVSTRGGSSTLTTGGQPITVTLGKTKPVPRPHFSLEALARARAKWGVSDNTMNDIGNFNIY